MKPQNRRPATPPAATDFPRPLMAAAAVATLLALAAVFWLTHPESGPAPAADAPRATLPAEFDRQEFLLVGGSQLVQLFPGVLADIVSAVHENVRTVILAGSAADGAAIAALLRERGLPDGAARILELPIRTMWVRDFGPPTVATPDGARELVDFHCHERRGNPLDDAVPVRLAELLGLPRRESALVLEGGDLLSNGLGLGLASARVTRRNEERQGWTAQEVGAELARTLGCQSWLPVAPLEGEPTGHIDLLAAFLQPDLVVVGSIDAADDPVNAALLDGTAAALAGTPTPDGPLRVERIALPAHADGLWRSYTSVVFANGVLLVPVFPDCCPELDAQALVLYRRLLPDREVVGIDASGLTSAGGLLRDVTLNGAAALSRPSAR